MQRAYVKYFETSICEHISFYYFLELFQALLSWERKTEEKKKRALEEKKITLKPRAEQVQVGK